MMSRKRWHRIQVSFFFGLACCFSLVTLNCGPGETGKENPQEEVVQDASPTDNAPPVEEAPDTSTVDENVGCTGETTSCGDSCVDLKVDAKNCGACGNVCNAGMDCKDGACACGDGQKKCGDTCVDTKTDSKHCGGCGKACKSDETCDSGQCVSSNQCNSGETNCSGSCVDTKTDSKHCGACGKACKTGESCKSGACEDDNTCAGGTTDCGGKCVDTKTDAKHCGACGKACKAGETCNAGACESGNACTDGKTDCSGNCVDTKTDSDHCGACGQACPISQECKNGTCVNKPCGTGQTRCGGSCVDTKTDSKHCGACGKACKTGESCSGGKCQAAGSCGTPVSYSKTVGPILSRSCSCHGGGAGGITFRGASAAYNAMLNKASSCGGKKYIVPKKPGDSYLIDKLRGTANCGGVMPRGGALPKSQVDAIANWICQGAKNN